MIDTLPLLPSTYTAWEWDKTNGAATNAQTANAYDAVSKQGRCAAFSHIVWNDLIDKINEALTLSGLSWDSQYGTSAACKITATSKKLTAKAFNGAALNVAQIPFFKWKWARSGNVPGYLGRENIRGYAETHDIKIADLVYGWYILELTARLNLLIDVLKNTADFGEFESTQIVQTYSTSHLTAHKSAILDFLDLSKSYLYSSVAALPSALLSSSEHITSYSESDFIGIRSLAMCAFCVAESYMLADLSSHRASYMDSFALDLSYAFASVIVSRSAPMSASILTKADYISRLTSSAAASLESDTVINSITVSDAV